MGNNFSYTICIFTVFFTFFVFFTTIFRRPYSSTKISFGIFGVSLIFWNLLEVLLLALPEQGYLLSNLKSSISLISLYFLVLFALHFPFFHRREVKMSFYVSFIGGIGYLTLIQSISIPLVEEFFPLEIQFFTSINHFLSRSFLILCILSFLGIIYYKLKDANSVLRNFMYQGFFLTFAITLAAIVYNYLSEANYQFLASDPEIEYIDLIYLTISTLAIFRFRFIEHYPGVLAIFWAGERPHPVIERVEQATPEGIQKLKNYLWRMYEVEFWSDFIDDFWFNIVIDETLDNAIEHGGKRYYDVVTVYVFETEKNLDLYVKDMGKGFDPSEVPDPRSADRKTIPTGRGIYILRKIFPVSWNFVGNEIKVRIPKSQKIDA